MASSPTEQWIIRRAAERLGRLNRGSLVEAGIGDDAAVLHLSLQAGQRQLLTTDTLIEGVHFDLRYMSLADVGYKALAVNLSDINAMGGESMAALGTLGVPRGATERQIDELLDGIEAALGLCREAGQSCALIGGDTVAAPQWMVGFTVLGQVEGRPLLRSGAKPGDVIWHSGTLGLSGVGLKELGRRGGALPPPVVESASGDRQGGPPTVQTHRRPRPPLSLGPWLQRNGYATAAQDLSDSLSQVALQLAAASGVGIELDFRGYAFAPEVAAYAGEIGAGTVAEFVMGQAEDYELLFTAPLDHAAAVKNGPVRCTQIGRVVEASRGSTYRDEHGELLELHASGFEHL